MKLFFEKYIVKSLILFFALIVLVLAFKYGVANLYYLKVDAYLERWQTANQVYSDELEDAQSAVDSMLVWHGHNPQYLDAAAKIFEWHAFHHYGDKTQYSASLDKAMELYLRSSDSRPMWPNTWIAMAMVKVNLEEFDDTFFHYINRSESTGPYNPDVNYNIAKTQLLYWSILPKKFRNTGLEHIKRTLNNNQIRFKLLSYSRTIGKQKIVCAIAKLNKINSIAHNSSCKQYLSSNNAK
ncbi:VpsP family polysaccharide biosynthesis protein [Algibacillus agarilyticus]|uniref:VpsP family polysaccharide biosynthesis protein n=1 Tax=Algibacillus agarilyticus TaxID=2234133 RepID=UPI000DCFFD1A|nr:VpsP family polysaccharide biosynthesis protein [Algibacillus agarilyticus]